MCVDRELILGRLVASRFDRRRIRFSGSRQVVVTRDEREIGASRIVAAATALLTEKHPPAAESRWRLAGQVEPISVEPGPSVKLTPVVVTASRSRATVRVDVVRDGKARSGRELTFAKEYLWRQAVARKDIPAGRFVTQADVVIETLRRLQPQPSWEAPYGKQAARAIPAGAVIAPNLLTSPRPAVVFKRNDVVRIRVDLGGFTLLAKGVAMSPGRVGETVRVQNIDSKRFLAARVRRDGTVEPLLEETAK
jgi:flagella basal body P-ring formation protein FlgA